MDLFVVLRNLYVTVTRWLPKLKSARSGQALALDALGSPIRRDMVRLIAERELSVGELATKLPVSRPAVSKHLRLLQKAGLVITETRGNRNYCRLEPRGFEAARTWLDQFWEDALGRFQLLAENTTPRKKRG